MNAMSNFQQQVAQWRQQRRQQETAEYAQQIRNDYVETEKSRNEALNRGDRETAAMLDDDLMRIEGEYQEFLASQPVQTDPRQVEFMRRISPFIEKYGQKGVAALDLAHQYATRPRNPNTNNPANTGMGLRPNTPAYFRAMRNLLDVRQGLRHAIRPQRGSAFGRSGCKDKRALGRAVQLRGAADGCPGPTWNR
jgi:hypothetical protein